MGNFCKATVGNETQSRGLDAPSRQELPPASGAIADDHMMTVPSVSAHALQRLSKRWRISLCQPEPDQHEQSLAVPLDWRTRVSIRCGKYARSVERGAAGARG